MARRKIIEADTPKRGAGRSVSPIINNLATIGSPCRAKYTRNFLALMDTKDVPAALKVKWNDLVKQLFG